MKSHSNFCLPWGSPLLAPALKLLFFTTIILIIVEKKKKRKKKMDGDSFFCNEELKGFDRVGKKEEEEE